VSELPPGLKPASAPVPRESASAVLLRTASTGGWEVLLGLRSRRSRFLPGHLSCPGGGLEPVDRPGEPGAYRRCASRELLEETGIELSAEEWVEAGERTTPPLFPIRFRTRFFVGAFPEGAAGRELAPASGENEALRLARPDAVLREWAAGAVKLPPPTLAILRAVADVGDRPLDEVARHVAAANDREESAPRIEFVSDVWMLPLRTATLPPASHTNTWMPGGRRFAIVDPGSDEAAEVARLLEVVERRRALGHQPAAVLLTHHHRDHVSGAVPVARALGLRVLAHSATFDRMGAALGGIERGTIADGERIDLGGMALEALHTPGHAGGHLVFRIVDREILIAGDLVSGLSTILIDPGDGDMDAYLDSLTRAGRLGCRTLLPGHGPPLPGKRLDDLLEHRLNRERRILAALDRGEAPLNRIAGAAYAETPGLPPGLTESQTRSHLIRLERAGNVERIDGDGASWRRSGGSS
jgi:glyoxylase-like metal-dependent hydrolase (beta-lactamase superfamily II)/8-oxo-dGTP pyrophosphatase MutT (NUDIX family)